MFRPVRAIVAALFLVAPLLLVTPASATTVVRYDVLGDSYASGYGVPPYTTDCDRSESSYGVLLDGRAGLDLDELVACARASTTSMVEGGQLAALDANTDLVLLSVGANDVGWAQPAVACLLRTDARCSEATVAVRRRVTDDLPGLLDSLYGRVAAAAPAAQVVVTGYPRLFSPRYGAHLGASPIEQKRVNDVTDLLNGVLGSAASRHGFELVDVTGRFAGHGLNAPDPWIFDVRLPTGEIDRRAFHPDVVGYEAYARAIVVGLRQGTAIGP